MDALIAAEAGITTVSQHEKVDTLEQWLVASFPRVDSPVEHFFTDDQYVRKIFMSAGSLITSKIHLTRHPFFVLQGKAAVWDAQKGVHIVRAPYFGITEAGTRRVLLVAEDSIWLTVHAKQPGECTPEDIEQRIIRPHDGLVSENYVQLEDGGEVAGLLMKALENENL